MPVALLTPAQAEHHPIARLQGITRRVGAVVSVDEVELSIGAGDFIALLGVGGSGNNALLRMLAGLEAPTSGLIDVAEERMVVFNDPLLLPWKTVLENVVLGIDARDAAERARDALRDVGFKAGFDALPAILSPGDALRVSIARALVRRPKLLLLDAPFDALDRGTRTQMHRLVESLWLRHDLTVVLATHDVDEAIHLADRIVVIDGGRVVTAIENDLPWPHDASQAGYPSLVRRLLDSRSDAPRARITRQETAR
jgi:sulfonate transport system ATP-binding protein